MKIVISDAKTGKTFQTELEKGKESALAGLKIGDSFDGGVAGAAGYKLKIMGGSDKDGFPMRGDVPGARRLEVLLSDSPGFRSRKSGERRRKKVRGNAVSEFIAQLNTLVAEHGEKKLEELFPPKEKKEKGEKGKA